MQYILENEIAEAVIDTHAAEIHSFQRKDTPFEYMWNGDPEFWSGRNPVLFPQVGSSASGINIYRGKEYRMGNHGFARNSEFEMLSHSEKTLVLSLKENEETLAMFPYRFQLRVTYQLEAAKLNIRYEITNNDHDMMPFGFGLHPAFCCPVDPEKEMTDYRLEFDADEESDLIQNRVLPLRRELFSQRILGPLKSPRSASITMTDGTHGVRVDTAGYRTVMFWSPKTAPFVCIEPWMFSQKRDEPVKPFAEKDGAILLEPGSTWTIHAGYEIF